MSMSRNHATPKQDYTYIQHVLEGPYRGSHGDTDIRCFELLGSAVAASAFDDLVYILKYELGCARGFTPFQIMEWFYSSKIYEYSMRKTEPQAIIARAFEKAMVDKSQFDRQNEGVLYLYTGDDGVERMYRYTHGRGVLEKENKK